MQFVSETVLSTMIQKNKGFDDKEIKTLREKEIHSEFLRSVIYNSQTVVNRAAFLNSQYLRDQIKISMGDVAALCNQGVIIPYFYREKTLADIPENLETVEARDKAAQEALLEPLQEAVQNAYAVRLAVNDDQNIRDTDGVAHQFTTFCNGLASLANHPEAEISAKQLYFDSNKTSEELPPDILTGFKRHLRAVGDFSHSTSAKTTFGRTDIYKKFFLQEGAPVPSGLYLPELKADPSLWMLMKLIDLKYTANLPAALGGYALTSASLPGISALPYEPTSAGEANSLNDWIGALQGRVIDAAPAIDEVALPRLRGLSLKEALTIRQLDSWTPFNIAQKNLLKATPGTFINSFTAYENTLNVFQREFSKYYQAYDSAPVRGTITKVQTFIYGTIRFLGFAIPVFPLVTAGLHPGIPNPETIAHLADLSETVQALKEAIDRVSGEREVEVIVEICIKGAEVAQKRKRIFSDDYSRRLKVSTKVQAQRDDLHALVNELSTGGAVNVLSPSFDAEKAKS